MNYFSFFIACFFSVSATAQSNFAVAGISPGLKKNADAIVRLDETTFTVENLAKATLQKHFAVTVFNENGEDEAAAFYASYDKFSKIKQLEGRLYDATGQLIQKLKGNNIKDLSLDAFEEGVSDSRMKIARFDKKSYPYPYTVEFNFIEETGNMMFYPEWNPLRRDRTAVEKSSFSMIVPPADLFRYKEIHVPQPVVIDQQNDKTIYTWSIANIASHEREAYSPVDANPIVLTAPVEFEMEGYHGNITTWSDVGKFYDQFNKGRDELPDNVKAKVKELTQNETSVLGKIQKLYGYLQQNTRYMSIQLGFGGWQTIEAKEVADKGYGDCKALSNYMKALLKEAGINSYQALIFAGTDYREIYTDFPEMQFNHVITCVPMEKDTLWLECTSQTIAMGYQGSFTGNRKALLILPGSGALINTTVYTPSDNLQTRTINVTVDEEGNGKASVITNYSGIQEEGLSDAIHSLNNEEQKNWLLKRIYIPSFELEHFSFSETKDRIPKANEKLELLINNVVTQSGTRVYIVPNLMANFLSVPEIIDKRKNEIYLNPNRFNFQDTDTVTYLLPADYEPEFIPEAVKIRSEFGEYTATVSFLNGNLIYYRNVIVNSGYFPASDYAEWMDFIKKIKKSDRVSAVFIKKNLKDK